MRVAVIQPSYAPWLGYMSMMINADLFIYYDDVQFDKNGWRNRNRVLVNGSVKWLTLSIDKESLGKSLEVRSLMRVMLASNDQFTEHKRLLYVYYKSEAYVDLLETLYPNTLDKTRSLVDSVITHTEYIAQLLGVRCERLRSSDPILGGLTESYLKNLNPVERKNERLLNLLKKVGCTEYVSGDAARAYLNVQLFMENGISVQWNPYKGDGLNLSVVHYLLTYGADAVLKLISPV